MASQKLFSINPCNGLVMAEFGADEPAAIAHKIDSAYRAFLTYRQTSLEQRAQYLQRIADILEERKQELAKTATLEMGKTIASAIAEVEKCAWVCRYYAEHGADFLSPRYVATDASQSYVAYQPLGVILAVMPWNFPYWQVFRFASAALMAGNTILLKHASNVPQCALAIQDLCLTAGLPQGVWQTLLIGSEPVAEIIADDRIQGVTLTGGEGAGRAVGAVAGRAIKKVVLELGGSDPFIVMPSADLEQAVQTAVTARCINNGQSCIAAKRFIAHRDMADRFVSALVERFQALRVGDPLDPDTDIGPLATPSIVQEVTQQVQTSVQMGAKVLCGGDPRVYRDTALGAGNFYPPTVITDIPERSPSFSEEIFAPVAQVFVATNIETAIKLANATRFGLGASAWTNDPHEQQRFITELEAGAVFINGMVKSDPRLPFGGIKRSGYGRELGVEGIREFVNVKTVWIK
jgi:succinate-semialdehyde dehydrogenase/glutarate-semialdehyde dehydrogenase